MGYLAEPIRGIQNVLPVIGAALSLILRVRQSKVGKILRAERWAKYRERRDHLALCTASVAENIGGACRRTLSPHHFSFSICLHVIG